MTVLSTTEAAKMLKLSGRTIRELAEKGKIPCRKIGSQWRFVASELEKWLLNPPYYDVRSNKIRGIR